MSEIDLKCVANNDLLITVTVKRADDTAVNLTGSTIKFSVVDTFTGNVKFSKTTSSGITITNAAGGVFTVAIAKADTAALQGSFIYEAVITDSSGEVGTITDVNNEAGLLLIRRQWATP